MSIRAAAAIVAAVVLPAGLLVTGGQDAASWRAAHGVPGTPSVGGAHVGHDAMVLVASTTPTARAVRSGAWSAASTWGGRLPASGAIAVVPRGITVTLDGATPRLRGLVVRGTLAASPTRDVAITADYVSVVGGRLRIGTPTAPYTKRARITLTGAGRTSPEDVPGMGSKVLAVMDGALDLHGRPVRPWTKLAADAAPGSSRVTLLDTPTGWRAGDRVLVATSSARMSQTEVLTVASVSGRTVTFTAPLRYRHLGSVQTVGGTTLDVRAEVGLLSRNITIAGDAASTTSRIGGHAMFMGTSSIRVRGVELTRMGQFNRLGRYPLHFHLMGGGCTSCYVKDSSVHDTLQRGIVLHDTVGVTVSGNVVHNTVGHAIVVETVGTFGNTIARNLVATTRQPLPPFTAPVLADQEDRLPAGIWMKAAANTVTGNHVAGSWSNGFIYDGVPGSQAIDFTANTAHAVESAPVVKEGDFDLVGSLVVVSGGTRPAADRISGYLAYHNAIGVWPEEAGPFVVRDSVLADNALQTENRGVGNRVIYQDVTFVGRLATGGINTDPAPVHVQYGSDVDLVRPVFARYGTVTVDGTDTTPTQALVRVIDARAIGAAPAWSLTDLVRTEAVDSSLIPAGLYLPSASPWLDAGGCAPTWMEGMSRCPTPLEYAELSVQGIESGAPTSQLPVTVVRSDGLTYARSDTGLASGLFAPTVVTSSGFSYRVQQGTPSGGWVVGLSVGFLDDPDDTRHLVRGPSQVQLPMASAPSSVLRTRRIGGDVNDDGLPTLTGGTLLAPAASLEQFLADPGGTYWWDPTTGLLTISVTQTGVVVRA